MNFINQFIPMTKITISLCFLFYAFTSHAQFDYSLDFVRGIDRNEVGSGTLTGEYTPTYSYRIGANFNLKVAKNLFLKTGLRYALLKTRQEINDLRWPSEIGPDGWMPDPTLPLR